MMHRWLPEHSVSCRGALERNSVIVQAAVETCYKNFRKTFVLSIFEPQFPHLEDGAVASLLPHGLVERLITILADAF
jgi:hypothetical protein